MNTVYGSYFDTVNSICADCGTDTLEACMQLCDSYERMLSKTIPGSDVWKINHCKGGPVPISPDTRNILECAFRFYQLTEGAFNIALKPLIDVWDIKHRHSLPSEEEITEAMRYLEIGGWELQGDCLIVPNEKAGIDLGGIAKGYIADRIADFLKSEGAASALLNFGGNIVCFGGKPDGSPWKIGLQTPFAPSQAEYFAVTELNEGTVVTSGIYERFFHADGRTYHHIIDPRTGWPSRSGILSASVIGKDSMTADALSTSLLLLGWEKGLKLAEENGYYALCITENGEVHRSEKWNINIIQ